MLANLMLLAAPEIPESIWCARVTGIPCDDAKLTEGKTPSSADA